MGILTNAANKIRTTFGLKPDGATQGADFNINAPDDASMAMHSIFADVADKMEAHERKRTEDFAAGARSTSPLVTQADRDAALWLNRLALSAPHGGKLGGWQQLVMWPYYAEFQQAATPEISGAILVGALALSHAPKWASEIGINKKTFEIFGEYTAPHLVDAFVQRKVTLTAKQHAEMTKAAAKILPGRYKGFPRLEKLILAWAQANPGANEKELRGLWHAMNGPTSTESFPVRLNELLKPKQTEMSYILNVLMWILMEHKDEIKTNRLGEDGETGISIFAGGYCCNDDRYNAKDCNEVFDLKCKFGSNGKLEEMDNGSKLLLPNKYETLDEQQVEYFVEHMAGLPQHPVSAMLVYLTICAAELSGVARTSPVYAQLQALIHRIAEPVVDRAYALLYAAVQAETTFTTHWPDVAPEIYAHLSASSGSKPSTKWLKSLAGLVPANMRDDLTALVLAMTECTSIERTYGTNFDDRMKGLLWAAALCPPAAVAPALARFAKDFCYQSVPGVGMRNETLGNACLVTLIHFPGGAGVPHLARLLARVKYPKVKKKIEEALNEAATAAGLTRGEFDELTIPTHGLDAGGQIEVSVGEGSALLSITGTASVEIEWRAPGGKIAKSIPSALKEHKDEVNAVKALAKEIEADLGNQPQRLQRMWLDERRWAADIWQQRYVHHPLVGALSRRLIWNVRRDGARTAGVWVGGGMQDVHGNALALEQAEITLWHPIECSVAEVVAWRERLAALALVQPFKQAHREVYLVTDAERRTGTYSNRFAGHIVKQHQLMALARINGWMVTYRIWADTPNDAPTHIKLPKQGLVAEFWTQGAGGDDPEVTDSQAYLYLTTDQLRFHRLSASAQAQGSEWGEAVAIADVPALVLSEVMRQCDLFVGVASVANDANWVDAGQSAEHPNQWHRTIGAAYAQTQAFSDLGAMAQTRRDLLAALLPSLAIGKVSRIVDGKFLRVEGKRRAYKIHLGSGNILMEPNDQYVCIVPARSEAGQEEMRLPFEGDQMLSIILSKAVLLAADDTIMDTTILSQIEK